ncbi:hypothetical protein A2316_02425 [Candidatus Falkowbacteria bacterium RIFOXYB2_FULL_38_15]|uniref:Glycosyltransferase subfamily 4-like N-terminal domain-containing protein n=1 Tax=Candidatus Falkowbacteria bacterium RIFOXYA2_FULL_38_12 TaxID=1797993 RepID=A0A1F5S2P1_9BACT|nr:MAG: hypothetical protein A2257_04190 [Candidatus Falkowbacteria bacterium RIFOXYA2_FULL_38_12]OGF33641.1 MAG: hypothetical protein A2316_02425 [Candidatus Falkowbacteria bacterium RIFOXYB2_FULL_38_15]
MNVTRDYLGGIGTSNVNLLTFLNGTGKGVIGIELNARRHMRGATSFWHLSPDWFEQHIFNIHDLPLNKALERAKSLKDVEKYYRPIISMVKKILRREMPDVLFLNGTYYLPWIISIAAHELGIPIVLRYAGVLSLETFKFKPRERSIFLAMEKSFRKRVFSFIFPSQLCRDVVEKKVYRRPIERAYVIPNPVNTPKIDIDRSVERRIAAVGRWDAIKNFKAFFDVHKILKKQNWDHVATFVTKREKIKNIPKTINLLAPMRQEGLYQFYKSQGLIIAPSLFETFGNVPMEAVCLGIPVLVSDKMGCADILHMAGLDNMVMSFDNLKEVAIRAKQLCGQEILPKQLNNLRKTLDPKTINEQVVAVMREAAGSI